MTSAGYIKALYRDEERLALVLIPRGAKADPAGKEPKVEQRVFTAEKAAGPKIQAWLRHMNARRYDVFVGMQPMREKTRTRFKGDVEKVSRVYLDIDEDGPRALQRIRADAAAGKIPPPRFAVTTSPGRCQVVWQLPPGDLAPPRAEALMRGLVREYGGDRAATDVSRVLRAPGFNNWKRDGCAVRVILDDPRALARPAAFPDRLYTEERAAPGHPGAYKPAVGGGRDATRSGQDWRQVLGDLRAGRDPAVIQSELESRRADKSNPRYYARRTVERAREALARQSSLSASLSR